MEPITSCPACTSWCRYWIPPWPTAALHMPMLAYVQRCRCWSVMPRSSCRPLPGVRTRSITPATSCTAAVSMATAWWPWFGLPGRPHHCMTTTAAGVLKPSGQASWKSPTGTCCRPMTIPGGALPRERASINVPVTAADCRPVRRTTACATPTRRRWPSRSMSTSTGSASAWCSTPTGTAATGHACPPLANDA